VGACTRRREPEILIDDEVFGLDAQAARAQG
jgi:hypothetical protein